MKAVLPQGERPSEFFYQVARPRTKNFSIFTGGTNHENNFSKGEP
jgi:hypothetical protein